MTELRIGDNRMDARVADGFLSQGRGHMFRREEPDYALLFRFGKRKRRGFHMLFVPFPLDIAFVVDGEVSAVDRMRPWIGRSRAECESVVELPADRYDVRPGDRVELINGGSDKE